MKRKIGKVLFNLRLAIMEFFKVTSPSKLIRGDVLYVRNKTQEKR